jgi:hypothetical protein
MIDSKTESLHGTLPFNRQLIAKAIDNLVKARADGIILKFFYDLPSVESSDRTLESSICAARASIALQTSLNEAEGVTNALDKKFRIPGKRPDDFPGLFIGPKALLPLPRFSKCASAVGFVDSTATHIPLIEIYQGQMFKSLHLVALEMATRKTATVDDSGDVLLAGKRLDLFHEIKFPATNSLDYIPLHDVLSTTSKTWETKIKNAIVIIGYDGPKIHTIETPLGPLGAHRFFIVGLRSLAESFSN